jgi:hypothetical protein
LNSKLAVLKVGVRRTSVTPDASQASCSISHATRLTIDQNLTMVRPMTSITVKLPETLDRKLRSIAKSRGENISVLARRALEKEVAEGVPDFAKMAERYRGMFNGPSDLSAREGYGSLDAR